jgi:hypothetical protein
MTLRLSQIRNHQARQISLEYSGETVAVSYNPGAVTINALDALTAGDTAQNVAAIVDGLAAFLVSWDVIDDAGAQLPVTRETLREMPMAFIAAVMTAVSSDMAVSADLKAS